MVTDRNKDSDKTPVKQGPAKVSSEPNKIGPATPYDFDGKNLTAYGGLLPVGTLLEKLGFQELVEETLKVKRQTRVMPAYQFILAMVLACYVGFSRLHHLRFVQREPMLTGILGVLRLPPQCTFWRFLAVTARQRGRATAGGATVPAAASLGSGQREVERRGSGYRHDGTHAVRQSDGSAQKLQPEEQRQEELSADPDVSGRDQGIHCRRVAQRRPSDGQTDRGASANGVCGCAEDGENAAGARGFGFLLLGRGASVRECEVRVHHRGPQDGASGGGVESGGVAAVATDRRRRTVRVLVSAGWLGESVPVPGAALREEAEGWCGGCEWSNTNCSRPRSTSTGCL